MEHFIVLSLLAILLACIQFSISCVLSNPNRWWPNATVPYTFNGFDSSKIEHIEGIMKYIEELVPCLKFVPASPEDTSFLEIKKNDTSCAAQVGYLNTKQYVYLKDSNIGTGCMNFGAPLHELCHALGMPHEHRCPTRNTYCVVNYDNIQEGKEIHFTELKNTTVTNFDQPHDCESITHYGRLAFSKNGLETLTCNCTIGQRQGLSEYDVYELNKMYCDNTTTTTTTTTTPMPTTNTTTTPIPTTNSTTTPIPTTNSTTTPLPTTNTTTPMPTTNTSTTPIPTTTSTTKKSTCYFPGLFC